MTKEIGYVVAPSLQTFPLSKIRKIRENPRAMLRSSSNNGENTTIPKDLTVHWVTALQPRRPSSRWTKNRSCT